MWPLAAAFLCAMLLGLLALLAYGVEPVRHLDAHLFSRISAHRHATAGDWADAIAHLADPLPMLGLLAGACGIALLRRRPGLALAAIAVVASANLTTQALKVILSHQKAQEILGGSAHLDSVAFPSGHATAAASIAFAFALVVSRGLLPLTALVGAAFALAVGGSVVVLGWHFPSDVLAGYLVAAGWGFAALSAVRAFDDGEPRGAEVSSRAALPSR